MNNIAISTDEVLAYLEDRYASCPRCIRNADINFATNLPFDLTAKFDKAKALPGQTPPSVR